MQFNAYYIKNIRPGRYRAYSKLSGRLIFYQQQSAIREYTQSERRQASRKNERQYRYYQITLKYFYLRL